MTTKITQLAVDDAVNLGAGYAGFNAADRRYVDDQIRGLEQHVVDSLLSGVTCTWPLLDSGSAALNPGDVYCASGTPGTVTKAVASALTGASAAAGIATTAATPGARFRGASYGLLARGATGLGAAAGYVRVNTTTARAEKVASLASNDFPLGTVDAAGNMMLAPMATGIAGGGGGGGSGITQLTGSVTTGVGGGVQAATCVQIDGAAGVANCNAKLAMGSNPVAFGATPAITGSARFTHGANLVTCRNFGNTADIGVISCSTNSADILQIGDGTNNGDIQLSTPSAVKFNLGGVVFSIKPDHLETDVPIYSLAAPYGVVDGLHGGVGTTAGAGTETVAAYIFRRIEYTQTLTGDVTITYPTPGGATQYYEKTIVNSTSGAHNLTFTCGAGAQVTVPQGSTAILGFKSTGDVVAVKLTNEKVTALSGVTATAGGAAVLLAEVDTIIGAGGKAEMLGCFFGATVGGSWTATDMVLSYGPAAPTDNIVMTQKLTGAASDDSRYGNIAAIVIGLTPGTLYKFGFYANASGDNVTYIATQGALRVRELNPG